MEQVLKQELHELYTMANDYVNGKNNKPSTILNKSAQLYVDYKDQLSPSLKKITGKSLSYVNMDFEYELPFDEYISCGNELIEELCGCLGEIFGD